MKQHLRRSGVVITSAFSLVQATMEVRGREEHLEEEEVRWGKGRRGGVEGVGKRGGRVIPDVQVGQSARHAPTRLRVVLAW